MPPLTFNFAKPRCIYVYRHLSAREDQPVLPYEDPPWRYSVRICLAPPHETMTTAGIRIEATDAANPRLRLNTWWVQTLASPNVTSNSGPGPVRILLGHMEGSILLPLRIRKMRKLLERIRPVHANSRDWTARALRALSQHGYIDGRLADRSPDTIISQVLVPLDRKMQHIRTSHRFAADYDGPVSPCPTWELFTMNQLSP